MRKGTLILISLLLPFFITGCFDSHEIGDFAYVTAMGVEHGISDTFRITFQISKFSKSSGGNSHRNPLSEHSLSGFQETQSLLQHIPPALCSEYYT
jgi:hypothetical protein